MESCHNQRSDAPAAPKIMQFLHNSAVLSLRLICSAVCLVRFMVESPAKPSRHKTLIHTGPISGVHVSFP